jgi:hypothetical protein
MSIHARGLRNGVGGIAALALALGLASSASADEVKLKSGQVVEGVARREPGKVVVETRLGTMTFPADQVQDIVPGRTPVHDYADRFAALGPSPKADDVYALALWSRDQGLVRYVHPLLERAIKIDPNFAPAHRLLDEVQVGGRWMTLAERDVLANAATRARQNTQARALERRVTTLARPVPEMDPGYTYLGFPPMVPRRGSQNYGCCGYVFPIFHGVAVVP